MYKCNVITSLYFFIQEYNGKGNCDGQFEQHRYFHAGTNCALFAAMNKVRRCPDPSAYKTRNTRKPGPASNHGVQDDHEDHPLSIGERVVWMSDDGPEHGSVKWIGCLPYSQEEELYVGVEFVSRPSPSLRMVIAISIGAILLP